MSRHDVIAFPVPASEADDDRDLADAFDYVKEALSLIRGFC